MDENLHNRRIIALIEMSLSLITELYLIQPTVKKRSISSGIVYRRHVFYVFVGYLKYNK